jgi:hypothetical protein
MITYSQFDNHIPTIDLLESYERQVARSGHRSDHHDNDELCKLMLLDSWLSLAGRQKEIASGPWNLLKRTSQLVQYLIENFEVEFAVLE